MVGFAFARHSIRRRSAARRNRDDHSEGNDRTVGVTDTVRLKTSSSGVLWVGLSLLAPLVAVGVSTRWLVMVAVALPLLKRFVFKRVQEEDADGARAARDDGRFTLQQRLAYKVDYSFSVVPYIKAVTLLILTGGLILVSGIAIYLTSDDSLAESLWEATAGVGLDWTFVGDDDSKSYCVRTIGVLTNIGGLVVTALLLGIVSDAVSMYLDNLRKGSCRVVESDFTLIIGWSNKSIPIIEQIAKANISENGGVVVVLAERRKESMEVEIAHNDSKIAAIGTRVVCRSGSPLWLADLRKVSLVKAKSIIVLADQDAGDDQSDVRCIRILLSLISALGGADVNSSLRDKLKITVEVCNAENAPLMASIARDIVEPVVANGVIGRLLVHAARQPQVATVWETLLGFDDNEFYLKKWPDLTGLTFGEVFFRFKDAIPLGVRYSRTGAVNLNPSDSRVIEEDDEILVLAEDDDSYQPEASSLFDSDINKSKTPRKFQAIDLGEIKPSNAYRMLLIGWRLDILNLIHVFSKLSQPRSEVHILSEIPLEERNAFLEKNGAWSSSDICSNLTITHHEGDPRSRRDIEKIGLHTFSSIIISTSGVRDSLGVEDRDSQTIVSLLLVQEILKQNKAKEVVVIGEIHNPRSRQMILDAKMADAVIATNDLISKSLAMVSEDSSVNRVLEDLFNAGGNEVQVVKASTVVEHGESLSFFEVMKRSRARNSIAIGYKRKHEELVLNPPNKIAAMVWGSNDQLVMLTPSKRAEMEN